MNANTVKYPTVIIFLLFKKVLMLIEQIKLVNKKIKLNIKLRKKFSK